MRSCVLSVPSVLTLTYSPQFREYLEANGFDTSVMGLPGMEYETSSTPEELDEKVKEQDEKDAVVV